MGEVACLVGRVGARHTARALGGGQGKDRPQPHRDTETSEVFCWMGHVTGSLYIVSGCVFSVRAQ